MGRNYQQSFENRAEQLCACGWIQQNRTLEGKLNLTHQKRFVSKAGAIVAVAGIAAAQPIRPQFI